MFSEGRRAFTGVIMTTYKVGYLAGCRAKASINRKRAQALAKPSPPALQLSEIPFKDLSPYSYD
jgi:hypothetical protein